MPISNAEVRLVGKDATAGAFRSAVRNAETASARISATFRSAFSFLGAGTAIYGLTRAVSGAIKAGDDLAKFAEKSGLAARAASELAHVAKMSDIDLGQFAVGVRNMQKSVSEAAEKAGPARQAFVALGIDWKELKKQSPDQQLEAVAEGLTLIKDPADKSRLAVELFGRAGADLLPMFSQGAAGIKAAREEAIQLGKSFSAEDLRRFQEADEAFKKLKQSGSSLADTLAIHLSPALIELADNLRITMGGGNRIENLRREIENLEVTIGQFNWQGMTPPQFVLDANAKLIELRRQLHVEALSRQPNTIGQSEAQGKTAPGITDPTAAKEAAKARIELLALGDAISKVNAQFEAQKAKVEDLKRQFPQFADIANAALQQIAIEQSKALEAASEEQRKLDESLTTAMGVATPLAQQYAHLAESLDGYSGAAIRAADATSELIQAQMDAGRIGPQDQLDLLKQPLGFEAMNDLDRSVDEHMQKVKDKVLELPEAFKEADDKMSVYADQAARNMQDAFADFLFDPFDRGIKGMLKGFIDILRRMVAEAAAAKIFEALGFGQGGAGGGGGGGILGSILGSLFGHGAPGSTPTVPPIGGSTGSNFAGLFATGGRLNPGEWGIVGDQGPELAFGGAHGQTIVPMGKSQPAQKVVNIMLSPTTNVHVDSRADRAAVRQETIAIVSEGNRQMFEALRDARSRGQF